ncbi:MAG: hypothetical protein ABEI54_05110 [Candidatus Bipolaricaulia bacterium]
MFRKIPIVVVIFSLTVGLMGISVGAENSSPLPPITTGFNSSQPNLSELDFRLSPAPLSISRFSGDVSGITGSNNLGSISQGNQVNAQLRGARSELLQEAGNKLVQFRNQYYLSQVGTVVGWVLMSVGSTTYPPNTALITTGGLLALGSQIWNLINMNKIGAAGKKLQEAGAAS